MKRGLTFHQMMVGLLFGAIAFGACLMPSQADTYWHLRAGREIWQTLHVPLADRYSYTATGAFWPNHEWLWQALSYGLYHLGGPRLLLLVSAAIVMSACTIMYRLMVGPTSTRFVLVLLGLPLATCVWALRPQIVSLLLLSVMLWILTAEQLWLLPFLFLLWANAHGAVAMGGAVLAAVTVVALGRARRGDARERRRALRLVLLTPLCALLTGATPLGFRLWRYIGISMALSRANQIDEWRPVWPTDWFGIAFWILAAAFLAVLVWRRRRLRNLGWADAVLLTAALVMLPLAFRASRNTAVFLLIAIPTVSRLLGPEFQFRLRRAAPARPPSEDHPRVNLALLIGISALEAIVLTVAWRIPVPKLGWQPLSPGALAAVEACPAEVYNRYDDGGYLIWFAPDKPVFLDSRQDPYTGEFMQAAHAIDLGGPYRETFARYGIHCAFLSTESKRLIGRLRNDGWKTSFLDDKWAVLVAPGAG